ncbi:MAG: hypothetical protein RLZZ293_290 [Pseudomonadota bacterium]
MKYLIVLVLSAITINVFADNTIYQYKDKNGTIVFTNKPTKNSQKVVLPPITVYAAPMTKSDLLGKKNISPKVSSNKNQPATVKIYPKTDTTQYLGTNEQKRQQILTEELASEQKALQDAQQALQNGKNKLPSEQNNQQQYQMRMQALQDSITEHQKNIDILSKQLGVNN